MFSDSPGLLQDVLVVVFLVALRVGVPVLILFAVGAWLKKLFEPETTSSVEIEKARREPYSWRGSLKDLIQSITLWLSKHSWRTP